MEDRAAGDTIDLKFFTSVNGTPTTLAGTPAVSVYKDNSTTESTAGVTLTVDFDARTGMHNVHITTASDGTFYANGSDFQVVITTGTVGGVSVVGTVIGGFSLANRTVNWGSVANPTTTVGLSGTTVKVQSNVKKNQALAKVPFLMTDSTNHAPATGKTVTVTRSLDGGAFASGTLANVTEVANGIYTVDLAAGDLNANTVVLRATAASCDDRFVTLITEP